MFVFAIDNINALSSYRIFNYNTFEYDNKRHSQGTLIAARIAKKIHRENRKKHLTNPH